MCVRVLRALLYCFLDVKAFTIFIFLLLFERYKSSVIIQSSYENYFAVKAAGRQVLKSNNQNCKIFGVGELSTKSSSLGASAQYAATNYLV